MTTAHTATPKKYFSVHLSKTGKPGGSPACGRGTRVTSGISVSPSDWANDPDKCGHCMRTNAGKNAMSSATLAKAGAA